MATVCRFLSSSTGGGEDENALHPERGQARRDPAHPKLPHWPQYVRFKASVTRSPASEIVSGKTAKEWLEIALRRDGRVFSDFEKFLFAVCPGRPVGQALSVRVAGFGEVRPVRLNQVRKRRIFRSKWQPMPDWVAQRAEHKRNFKTVKCAQLFFSPAGNRTVKSVHMNALAGVAGQGCHGADRANEADVTDSLVHARGTTH